MTSAIIQQPYGVIFAKEHMSAPFIICGSYLGFIYVFSNHMKYKDRIKAFLIFALKSSKKAASIDTDIIYATSTPLTISFSISSFSLTTYVPC